MNFWASIKQGMERDSAADYSEVKAVLGSNEEKKVQKSKKDKEQRKRKKDKAKGHGGDGDRLIQSDDKNHSVDLEHAEVSAKMAEKPSLENTEVIMSKRDLKKDRKKKKKNKEFDTISQKQIIDANDGTVGSEQLEMYEGEGEHDSNKLKKGKRKHRDGETSSNGSSHDQIVPVGDKKRKRKEPSITLEEGNEVDTSKIWQTTEGKKKRRKERDNIGVDLMPCSAGGFSRNLPATTVFFSHAKSASYSAKQYFPLTRNQPASQPASQPNKALAKSTLSVLCCYNFWRLAWYINS